MTPASPRSTSRAATGELLAGSPAAPGLPPSRPGCPPTAAAAGGSPGCAGRSRCWPGSASTTTSASSAAGRPARPRASWRASPARCSWTRPSAPTCSTWPTPPPRRSALSNLIGELSTRSENFRTWWAAHNVRFHRTGVKRFQHPVVGDFTLTYEALDLAADSGLRISAYSAEPGTPSDDALKLLTSWAATLDEAGHTPCRAA